MLPLYSRCTQLKDVRHESNGKFITYSYPPPFAIITTISRHLQWLQSWECIQAIRAASPTALTAAPSVMGLILKGSIPLETLWLIEMENLLLASSNNESRQEASMMAELYAGLVEVVWCWRGLCAILLMMWVKVLTLWFAISCMRTVSRQQLYEDVLTHQVNKTCVCLMIIRIL